MSNDRQRFRTGPTAPIRGRRFLHMAHFHSCWYAVQLRWNALRRLRLRNVCANCAFAAVAPLYTVTLAGCTFSNLVTSDIVLPPDRCELRRRNGCPPAVATIIRRTAPHKHPFILKDKKHASLTFCSRDFKSPLTTASSSSRSGRRGPCAGPCCATPRT